MKKLLAIPLLALAFTASAGAYSPPNTYDLQIITGEGHQVTATWRSTEPSHFKCWLTKTSGGPEPEQRGRPAPLGNGKGDGSELDAERNPAPGGPFMRLPCTPPKTYDGLAPGTYTLHVRAFGNESGLHDPTPALDSFRIAP